VYILSWHTHSVFFFFSSRRRHTRFSRDWSSDVCSSDLGGEGSIRRVEYLRIPGRTVDDLEARRGYRDRQLVVVLGPVANLGLVGRGPRAGSDRRTVVDVKR